MRESRFQNKIISKLKKLDNCWYVKVWGGGFQRSGIPDILICYKGHFVAIELKNETGEASELQKYNINKINDAKGIALVIRPQNEDELWNALKKLD